MQTDDENLIRRIADYERISGILWLVLAVIQICTIVGAIAGIWNIFAGMSRLPLAKRIRKRDPTVPKEFEGIAGLIIIGVINLVVGGVIGVAFVGFDFYIRDKVLTNKHLFTGAQASGIASIAAPPPIPVAHGMPTLGFDQQLRTLAKLREDGVITGDDFDRKKREILGM